MKQTHPLEILSAFGVLGAVVAGKLPLAVLLALTSLETVETGSGKS